MSNTPKKLDYDLFEYIIAYNCTIDDLYIAIIIDSLKIEYLTNAHIRNYLGIIFDFYKSHQTLPNATEIKTYLNNDDLKQSYKEVVLKFKTLDSSYNHDELLANTEQFIKERAVYQAVKTTVNKYTDSDAEKDTNEIYQLFHDACNINLIDNLGFDYLNRIDDHITDLKLVDKFIPTGFKWMDKMLGGGWLEGGRALYMFMGVTNVGKSIVLGNVASKLLQQGRTVVVISLEMPEPLYCKRISAQLSRIPFAKLKNETQTLNNYLKSFRQQNSNARLILKEFPPSSITANHVSSYLKKLQNKWRVKPDAVILDYLTLMLAINPTGSMYSDGKAVAEQIRALSYPQFFGCPFISAGQITRCLSLDTTVLKSDNTIARIGDIKVNDKIQGNNKIVRVLYKHPIVKQKVYKITTKRGNSIICSNNHMFPTTTGNLSIKTGLKPGCKLFSANNNTFAEKKEQL